jgi:hypothetical protein
MEGFDRWYPSPDSDCYTLPKPPSAYRIVSAYEGFGTAESSAAKTIPDAAAVPEQRIIDPLMRLLGA